MNFAALFLLAVPDKKTSELATCITSNLSQNNVYDTSTLLKPFVHLLNACAFNNSLTVAVIIPKLNDLLRLLATTKRSAFFHCPCLLWLVQRIEHINTIGIKSQGK